MRSKLYAYAFSMLSMAILLSGCGNGGGTPAAKNTLHESTVCLSCHDDPKWVTPGTGKPVVTGWKLSTHMTADGAGCSDCHDDGYMHPASCNKCHSVGTLAKNPTKNPDQDNKCAKCHAVPNPRPGQNNGYNIPVTANGVPPGSTTGFLHFSTGLRTSYVSSYNRMHCRNCHDPHDTTFGREQRKEWSESGHGITRGLARILLDGKTRGTRIPLDQNIGNANYCVRCHTSTGFINFVAGDLFTNVNALPDIGADGLPDPNGYRSNWPEYKIVSNVPVNAATNIARPYSDKSREATNCNVCHLDNPNTPTTNPSSYSGTLRKVALTTGVKIYYPYSSSGSGKVKIVTPIQYDTMSNSNLCLTCHSGRATGQTIKSPALFASISSNRRPSAPSVHDFAGGAVMQAEKSTFLFYTDPAKYKTFPTHRAINVDGNGPCISCHMPMKLSALTGGLIHTHLFTPVSWNQDDLNQDITEIISNPTVCSRCHNDVSQPSITPKSMNDLRKGFRMSVLILAALRPSSNNWTGRNTNGGLNITYGNALVPSLGNMRAGVYTMGASFNYGVFFNEPSAYNHTPILARQLIYDSIDWLKNGAAGFGTNPASVYAAIKNVPIPPGNATAVPPVPPGFLWTKVDVNPTEITGVSSNRNYAIYATEADREAAFFWLCKDYVPGSNVCNRW
jgi:hypothetical protein